MMGFVTNSVNTSYTITNFEVLFEIVQLPQDVAASLLAEKKLFLKSISFVNTSQFIAQGTSGSLSLNYNVALNSIKSIFLLFAPTTNTGAFLNGSYDSAEITQGSGEYSFYIGNQPYPQKPLSVLTNKAGVLTELRKATTSLQIGYDCIFDKANNSSIGNAEFVGALSTIPLPSKFIVGVHTETLHNNNAIFSGVSSQGSAIVAKINCPTQAAVAVNANPILCFDALMECDLEL
jgi:hypothetical protein